MKARPIHRLSRPRLCATANCALALLLLATDPLTAQDRLRIVATLPTYAAIARELAGDLAQVNAIARGDEDPHFVNPRPSFAAMVSAADLFIVTGLDLELWVPAVVDRARNARVVEGAPGHVVAYSGIKLLDIPQNVSRTGGDVHVFGNPHIHTDPVNAIIISRNMLAKLSQVDPANKTLYEDNARAFENRVLRRLFGDELVDLLGADAIMQLARNHQFWEFAASQTFQDKPLTDYIGGWLAEGAVFRDRRMACYHKNWAYFSARFRVPCSIYIEPKPGIPPSPGHLRTVVEFMRDENVRVLFGANYYSRTQVERVASRTNARAVIVPEHVDGEEGVDDYFKLVDIWVSRLAEAFTAMDRRSGHRE